MATKKNSFLLTLRAVFFVLGKLPFVLALLFIGFFAFWINDQGLDLMAAFSTEHLWNSSYQILFVLFLMLWANTIWNVSRVLLKAANLSKVIEQPASKATVLEEGCPAPANYMAVCIDEQYARTVYSLYKWVPRVLIFMPYLIFIVSWLKVNGSYSGKPIAITVLAITHFLIITYRLSIADRKSLKAQKAENKSIDEIMELLKEDKGFLASLKKARIRIIAVATLVLIIIVFIYACVAAFADPIEKGKPGLIILSALIFYTLITFLLDLASKRLKLPLFLILVIFSWLISKLNNNHAVEMRLTSRDVAMLAEREALPDTTYFRNWLQYKIDSKVYRSDSSDRDVIFLVAAEGGGIRDCYWTEVMLKELQTRNPAFYSKTFAVTGASGGSVGLGFYYGYLFQNQVAFRQSGYREQNLTQIGLDSICTADFLSRVTFGFLYPDLWQRFLPFKISGWDRGKYLSQSFDGSYSASLPKGVPSILSDNYLRMWSRQDRYQYPVILFNSLYVEKGTKAIFSPFRLSSLFYPDALDVLSVTKRAVPLRECMVSTARFPFVTPPGLLLYDSLQRAVSAYTAGRDIFFGHLIDGGGFDNKAIQTAQQTAVMMKKVLKSEGLDQRFAIKIVYLGYGTEPLVPGYDPTTAAVPVAAYEEPLGRNYELAPVIGGSNAIFRWIYSAHGLTTYLDSSLNVIDFGLRSKRGEEKHILPLGWYLSPYSKEIIRNEVRSSHLDSSYTAFSRAVK